MVCLLSKLNVERHIEIELDLSEMDLTKAESKATYEVKEHVKEHTGNLYIAQTKQKCGIIERENYNRPKLRDTKVPKCSVKKETSIMEAFRYFQMI